jgi:hypothetical protein
MRRWTAVIFLLGCIMSVSEAQPVNRKDLVEHYADYNGKRITVIGEVASSDEMTVMYLPAASGEPANKEGMLITLSEAAAKKPTSLLKRFTKDLKKTGRVTAELEGRFEGAADRRWGHQACCRFRLQVERVVSLK